MSDDYDLDDLLAENAQLRAEIKRLRETTRYDDGSTKRHIRREESCQWIANEIIEGYNEDDQLRALQAWEVVRNDAERMFINRWLSTKQREWLRSAEATSLEQMGI